MIEIMPFVTLTNQITVANFSSPHPFEFEDGTILPACSKERAEFLKLETLVEKDIVNIGDHSFFDMHKKFLISDNIDDEIQLSIMYIVNNNIDVIIVPFPQLLAMDDAGYKLELVPFDNDDTVRAVYRSIESVSRFDKRCKCNEFCTL